MSTTVTPALCPELATPSKGIITKETVNSLKLSDYSRQHGTTVTVTCLTAPDYRLVGASTLTCLDNSQWDKPVPRCEVDSSRLGGDGVGSAGTDGSGVDLTMLPVMVTAGVAGLMLLGVIGILVFVNFCWRQGRLRCHAERENKAPIGLFRSLSVQEAESAFSDRRHRYYTASECSDVIDSISTRCPPQTHIHSLEVIRQDPYSYQNIRALRQPREPSVISLDQSENVSRSPASTYYTARSKETQPSLKTRVGTRQSYRTWHELFYAQNH